MVELISNKRKKQYDKIVGLLKSILQSIHGVRDKQGRKDGGILFGLVPEEKAYEHADELLAKPV